MCWAGESDVSAPYVLTIFPHSQPHTNIDPFRANETVFSFLSSADQLSILSGLGQVQLKKGCN